MSAPYIVPFNFQPVAISVKTTSYTIPAGKYARVVVNLEGSATFTIGGVTALRGTQNSVLGSSPITHSTNGSAVRMAVGDPATFTNGLAYASATDQKTLIADFFCPTGTVISGTVTWRAIVTEYNNIT